MQDLKGNLTEFEINTKEYAVQYYLDNRMNKVDVDGSDVEYRYDAMGRRVLRKEGSTTTAFIWRGNSEQHRRLGGVLDRSETNCLVEVSGREADANQCAEHKHAATMTVIQNDILEHPSRLNAVIARAVDGSKTKLEWYHKNYLDHVYAVSDNSGDILEHYRYTAFGEVTIYEATGRVQDESQINNSILWNTRRLDSVSGFYLYEYRHYSPELGRWLGRDPLGNVAFLIASTKNKTNEEIINLRKQSLYNLYMFSGNDGVNKWDLLGLEFFCTVVFDASIINNNFNHNEPEGGDNLEYLPVHMPINGESSSDISTQQVWYRAYRQASDNIAPNIQVEGQDLLWHVDIKASSCVCVNDDGKSYELTLPLPLGNDD